MKRKIILVALATFMCMGIASCSKDEENLAPVVISGGETTLADSNESEAIDETQESSSDAYYVTYNGIDIHMNQESASIIEALGDNYSYFEAPSCAYEGLDKIYTYNSIAVYSYTMNGVDYISSVQLRDDTVATNEGIRIGSSADDVYRVYGEDGVQGPSGVEFFMGDSILAFVFDGSNVSAITYTAIVG